jgi:hypothetical protein
MLPVNMSELDFRGNVQNRPIFETIYNTYLLQYDNITNSVERRRVRLSMRAHLNQMRHDYMQDKSTTLFLNDLEVWAYKYFYLRTMEYQWPHVCNTAMWKFNLQPLCARFIELLLSNSANSIYEALERRRILLSGIKTTQHPEFGEIFELWFKEVLSDIVPDQDADRLIQAHENKAHDAFQARVEAVPSIHTHASALDNLDALIESQMLTRFSEPAYRTFWEHTLRPACDAFWKSTETDVDDHLRDLYLLFHIHNGQQFPNQFLQALKTQLTVWIHAILLDRTTIAPQSRHAAISAKIENAKQNAQQWYTSMMQHVNVSYKPMHSFVVLIRHLTSDNPGDDYYDICMKRVVNTDKYYYWTLPTIETEVSMAEHGWEFINVNDHHVPHAVLKIFTNTNSTPRKLLPPPLNQDNTLEWRNMRAFYHGALRGSSKYGQSITFHFMGPIKKLLENKYPLLVKSIMRKQESPFIADKMPSHHPLSPPVAVKPPGWMTRVKGVLGLKKKQTP